MSNKTAVFSEERDCSILNYLKENSRISIEDVSRICDVSASTARIYLNRLAQANRLLRTRGGAVAVNGVPTVAENTDKYDAEKTAIAACARKTIQSGDIIAIGGGSTAQYLAKALLDASDIVVFTNSVYVAYTLLGNRNIEVQLCGGVIRGINAACVGPRAEEFFQKIRVYKSYIGTDSITAGNGFTTINADERTEKSLLLAAKERYVLADHSKFSVGPYPETVAHYTEIHHVITDSGASAEDVKMLRDLQVDVIVTP